MTGYGAAPRWLVQDASLDFQEWSPFPYGGPFGAVGIDASWGHRWADLFAEVSRSVDSQGDRVGGGWAGILRHTATFDNHELEVSGRYYDSEFENPFARPIAAIDQNEGLRWTCTHVNGVEGDPSKPPKRCTEGCEACGWDAATRTCIFRRGVAQGFQSTLHTYAEGEPMPVVFGELADDDMSEFNGYGLSQPDADETAKRGLAHR